MHAAATMTLTAATVAAVMTSGVGGGVVDGGDGNHDDTFICPCSSTAKHPSI